jgi:hypothetical protein
MTPKLKNKPPKDPLDKGILFFESTIDGCQKLLVQSQKAKELLDNKNKNPYSKTKSDSKQRQDILKWMSSSIDNHKEELNKLLEVEIENITTMLILIKGFQKEMLKGNQTTLLLLQSMENDLKKEKSPKTKVKKLISVLDKKCKLAQFFEDEVKERSHSFSKTLSSYITHHIVLSHIIDCTKLLDKSSSNEWLSKRLKNMKNPIL